MTSEMDLMHLDERQRLAWLMANRGTLIAVGLTWIGLVAGELSAGRLPLFLIVMVPVFAALRAGLFFYYCSAPIDVTGRAGGTRRGRLMKTGAAMLLALALFLPLYAFPARPGSEAGARLGFVSDILRGDWAYGVPLLALAFLWPIVTLALTSPGRRRWIAVPAQLAEPILATLSVLIVLSIPAFEWEARFLWIFLLGFESARPAAGTYLAVAANGLYVVAWLWETLRPWVRLTR